MAYVNIVLSLCFALCNLSGSFLIDESGNPSCLGKCGDPLSRDLVCQCNDACIRFNDCCADYASVCQAVSCKTVSEVSRQMWSSDVNRLPDSAFQLNYQSQVSDGDNRDRADHRLFTHLDETQLATPTYQAYMRLLDNYDPVKGVTETSTPEETNEVNHFLDAVLATDVMRILLDNLKCLGIAQTQSDLRGILYKLWFAGYPRSGNAVNSDTSGFEHVMVGEFKSQSKVNGFHGWLSFYLKEKAGDLNYRGYVRKQDPHLVGASFTWQGRQKALGSMMLGTSPEFEMAIFSLCFLTHRQSPCQTVLGGQNVTIQTYAVNGHVATAFYRA